jgi:predicted lipase
MYNEENNYHGDDTHNKWRRTLVKNPMINQKKDELVTTTNGTYPWSSATQIVSYNLTSLNGHRKTSEHTNQA